MMEWLFGVKISQRFCVNDGCCLSSSMSLLSGWIQLIFIRIRLLCAAYWIRLHVGWMVVNTNLYSDIAKQIDLP